VEVARASLDYAKAKRADTVLWSPFDGAVTGRYMDPGAVATVGQPILAVQFFRDIWVSVAVPDTVSAKVRLGQQLQVSFDALPGRTFLASVIQVNPAADPQARQYTVRAALANPQRLLRPGMFAHVLIVTDKATGVVAVPREAVQEDDRGTYVMTVDAQNQAHRQAVSTGMGDDAFIAITRGLQPGQKVVTFTSTPLKDGQTVDTGEGRRGPRPSGGSSAGRPSGRPVTRP
jgi:RND family efflux transporter MFP subunit